MKKFVTFDCDWADEFSVYGFRIFTPSEWDDYVASLKEHSGNLTFGFGTNEGWEDEDADHYLSAMKVIELSDEDVAKLTEIFDLGKSWKKHLVWGTFPDFDFRDLDIDEL